jgi:hypothetical protein
MARSDTIDFTPPTRAEWLVMRRTAHELEPVRTHRREIAKWFRELRKHDRVRTRELWRLLHANARRILDHYPQAKGPLADLVAPVPPLK